MSSTVWTISVEDNMVVSWLARKDSKKREKSFNTRNQSYGILNDPSLQTFLTFLPTVVHKLQVTIFLKYQNMKFSVYEP